MLPHVSSFQENDALYLDKIGQMQLFSEKFQDLVLKYFNAPNTCLATMTNVFENDFIKKLRERDDVILVEISTENREEKEVCIRQLLNELEKAKICC